MIGPVAMADRSTPSRKQFPKEPVPVAISAVGMVAPAIADAVFFQNKHPPLIILTPSPTLPNCNVVLMSLTMPVMENAAPCALVPALTRAQFSYIWNELVLLRPKAVLTAPLPQLNVKPLT